MAGTNFSSSKTTRKLARSTLLMPLSRCGRSEGQLLVHPVISLLLSPDALLQVQRDLLYDRYLSSEHHVFEVVFTEHSRNRIIETRRKLLFGESHFAQWIIREGLTFVQYENDNDIGVAVIDSFTHHALSYLESVNKTSQTTMRDFVS